MLPFVIFSNPSNPLQENTLYVHKKENEWYVTSTGVDAAEVEFNITSQTLITLLESPDKALLNDIITKSLVSFIKNAQHPILQFDYSEHNAIGQTVQALIAQYLPEIHEGTVTLGNGLNIEISEFYALMGDFFGLPDESISSGSDLTKRKDIFQRSFQTLYDANPKLIKEILVIGAIQKQALSMAKQNCTCQDEGSCDCAEKALEGVSSITNQLWNKATGGAFYLYPIFQGEYLKLSKNNVDHFASSARDAYTAGHELALDLINEIALESKNENPDVQKIARLTHQALAVEASAGHFLTDAFSSGHVRVPRKELYELKTIFGLSVPSAITGLFTLVMHNDDGKNGLWITDKLSGDEWKAFGDDSLLTGKGRKNKEKVCTAASIGMQEIIGKLKEAQGKEQPQESFPEWGTIYELIPEECAHKNINQPLFKVDDEGKLLRRKDVNDPLCQDYISNWWIGTTLMLLLPQVFRYAFSGSSSQAESENQDDTYSEEHTSERGLSPRLDSYVRMSRDMPANDSTGRSPSLDELRVKSQPVTSQLRDNGEDLQETNLSPSFK